MRRTARGHGAVVAVGRARRVMRSAVSVFFGGYHCFSSVAAVLALPFSAAVLASEALAPSSALLHGVASRLRSVFAAAGFPPSSAFFALLEAKLAQTVVTFAFALPFALTFLLLAKACVAAMLRCDDDDGRQRRPAVRALPPCGAVARAYPALVATHLFNAFLMLSANAAVFSLLLLAFGAADLLGATSHFSTLALSAAGAVVYSLAVGVATVVCNLAVVVAAMESERGHVVGHAAVLRACVLIRGRVSTALALALPTNLGMAAAEALFQLRVVEQHRRAGGGRLAPGVAGEAFSIAYIHALCAVLEIIVSCMFYRSCVNREADEVRELEPEEKGDFQA